MRLQVCLLIFVSISVLSCSKADNAQDLITHVDDSHAFPYHVVESGHIGGLRSPAVTKFDPEIQIKFDRIQQYECAAVAYAQLGTPAIQGKDIPARLKLENVFQDDSYGQPVEQYLVWQNSDKYYCLGFNQTAEVLTKYQGNVYGNEGN